jgi:hypothetical protein
MSELTDNCGNCVTEDAAVTACPVLVSARPDGQVKATYRCPGCGHRWETSWNAEVLSLPLDGAA